MESCDVIGRVSKAIGLDGALPDIAGLAWRGIRGYPMTDEH